LALHWLAFHVQDQSKNFRPKSASPFSARRGHWINPKKKMKKRIWGWCGSGAPGLAGCGVCANEGGEEARVWGCWELGAAAGRSLRW